MLAGSTIRLHNKPHEPILANQYQADVRDLHKSNAAWRIKLARQSMHRMQPTRPRNKHSSAIGFGWDWIETGVDDALLKFSRNGWLDESRPCSLLEILLGVGIQMFVSRLQRDDNRRVIAIIFCTRTLQPPTHKTVTFATQNVIQTVLKPNWTWPQSRTTMNDTCVLPAVVSSGF